MRKFVSLALATLCRDERGQTMAEYGVVLALVTLAVIGSMMMLSSNIGTALEAVAGIFP